MVPDLARRAATGSALFITLAVWVVGCGEAVKTPFFEAGASSGGGTGASAQGGSSGDGTGGSAAGGDAGVGGTALGGDAGMSGTAGLSGSGGVGATAGTGSGGASGAGGGVGGVSGTSGTDTGGTGGAAVDCSSADPAAVGFENHCYLLRTTPRTWTAARDDCAADGAHLVTVSSEGRTEEQFLAENAFVWTLGGPIEKWMGLTDGRQSNQTGNGTPYTWITGEPMTHDNWSAGQPNNSQSACMAEAPCTCGDMCWEHCGFMWDPDNDEPATWNDRHCEHLVAYVCEWDSPPM